MILLTGFEPFGGETINPSWVAAEAASATLRADGHAAAAVELPCVFGQSVVVLREALQHHKPELVICVGQAGGRPRISLERVAINCDDARIPDNAGNRPVDEEVIPGGPAAYFSSLPVKASLAALRSAGIPAEVSQSAGTYVCNHVFYALMHAINTAQEQSGSANSDSEAIATPATRGGFIHVPYETQQVPKGSGTPSLPAAVMAEALAVVVRTALATTADIRLAAGSVH
ncbi:pyroglutamyl-peptidase I [Arthrobacter sp. ISL-72]|uniref:pyroglutamyl-peptidase I n=1 Tax=Arthrobacter sp. ISL-72 TaxID=2819114 RepID=UPI001BE89790|nr:pyroglutamyl-peptidase I [Arthrobacter sp. ISL-72]MBT2595262.1 pyroglutamyl-peptidase I [Arthrobacter sp. ISL-72]